MFFSLRWALCATEFRPHNVGWVLAPAVTLRGVDCDVSCIDFTVHAIFTAAARGAWHGSTDEAPASCQRFVEGPEVKTARERESSL